MTRLGGVNNISDGRRRAVFVAILAVILSFIGISLVAGAYFIYNKVVSEESCVQGNAVSSKNQSATTTSIYATTTTISFNKLTTTIEEAKPKTIPCNSPSVCVASTNQCTGTFTKQNCGIDSPSNEQGCCYPSVTTTTLPENNGQNDEYMNSPYKCNKYNLGFFDKWI